MSLTVCITTQEGIVLAADSRQSYKNIAGVARIGSDSATKLFSVGEKVGVTVAGPAFFVDPSDKDKSPKGINSYISAFLNKMNNEETVETIATKLREYLEKIYNPTEQLKKLEPELERRVIEAGGRVVKKYQSQLGDAVLIDWIDKDSKPQTAAAGIMPISLIVAGYDMHTINKPELNMYVVNIPGLTRHVRKYGDKNQYGASWTGQGDVLTRIIKGYDPSLHNLPFIQAAKQNLGESTIKQQLESLEYLVNWGVMTLRDAVDIAKLMIQTTIAIQRFSDGTKLVPGGMPGVGGPIDVAVILPDEGFHWHQKKALVLEKTNNL